MTYGEKKPTILANRGRYFLNKFFTASIRVRLSVILYVTI